MQQLLAILLYLFVIISPNTYFQSEIDAYEEAYQSEIQAVQQDAALLSEVLVIHGPEAENIVVLDDVEGN